ncbi:hypothetical protein KM043_007851 [Ampulex compressa]|nr:hypothetical protein KM043_007851 [Ampulex compressa]
MPRHSRSARSDAASSPRKFIRAESSADNPINLPSAGAKRVLAMSRPVLCLAPLFRPAEGSFTTRRTRYHQILNGPSRILLGRDADARTSGDSRLPIKPASLIIFQLKGTRGSRAFERSR